MILTVAKNIKSFTCFQVKEKILNTGDLSPLMVSEEITIYTYIYTDLKTTYFYKHKTWNYLNENSLCIKYNTQIKWLHNLQ